MVCTTFSPLEEAGFELLVPRRKNCLSWRWALSRGRQRDLDMAEAANETSADLKFDDPYSVATRGVIRKLRGFKGFPRRCRLPMRAELRR